WSASSRSRACACSTRTRAAHSPGSEASEMLVDYPILTLIVFLPALGALLSYVAGSARAARWIALGFSLLLLALAAVVLAGFLWPDASTLPKMVTPVAHPYCA